MNDFLYTVEFLDGRAKGGVYRVLQDYGVSKDIFSIGNENGIGVSWTNKTLIDSLFDTRVTLNTSNFVTTSTPPGQATTTLSLIHI